MRRVGVVFVVAVLFATACTHRDAPRSDQAKPTTTSASTTTNDPQVPTTTEPPCIARSEAANEPVQPTPPAVAAAIDERIADRRFTGRDVSISIWIDGWGEVGAHRATLPLLPASNQKLLTAIGALEVLGPDRRLVTAVRTAAAPVGGVVRGDLVLVGGGDPTLRRVGPHSLQALARQVRQRGVTAVEGSLLVDESHFDHRREAEGWLSWHRPTHVGSLSALVVDGNQYRSDGTFLADPATVGAELFRRLLEDEGVSVAGAVQHGTTVGSAHELARLESASVAALVETMLMHSDNMIAELLVKEIDTVRGGEGSTAGGLQTIRTALEAKCIPVSGTDADGSGLSRSNSRSAREWSKLLIAARDTPWGHELVDSLPIAGRSGTLSGRLTGAATEGNVRAKTGSIIPGRALSGYLTTAGGREAVFSVVVNGTNPGPALGAIDALVTTVAAARG